MKRIGLFGGSFDPVHNAHVALARLALDRLALDELRWIPAGQPWQKARRLASAEHRAAMVSLAIAGEPRFRLERCELERAGPSFTLDSVRELQAREPDAQWFLVIGQDQYANLHTWHGWQELLSRVTLAVAGRGGELPCPGDALAQTPHRVLRLPLPPMPESSTALREALVRPDVHPSVIRGMVPAPVARYIARHHLYSRTRSLDIRKLQRAIVDGLEDVKAQNILVFNTEHLTPLFERVIIASGTSNRQTKALASSVRDAVKGSGFPVMRTEGEDNGEWIIVDCGAAVAHIMQPAIRDYYHLEEIWGSKPVKVKLDTEVKGLVKASAPVKKTAARKAPAKKAPAGKTTAKAPAKAVKTAAKRAAAKPPARKAPAKKAITRTVGVKGAAAKKTAARPAAKKAPVKKKTARAR